MLELFKDLDPVQWLGVAALAFSAIMFVLSQLVPDDEPATDETAEENDQ